MDWIKNLFENRLYAFMLLAYMISQFYFPISELLFVISIIVAIIWVSKTYKNHRKFTPLPYAIILNFIANLILTMIYIPTLILNPEINWSLKNGGQESDPMILLAYFPTLNFCLFLIIMLLTSITLKLSTTHK